LLHALGAVLAVARRRFYPNTEYVTLSSNSLRQTGHTHRTSVHHAAKLIAALLRVAGVNAGLAESNGFVTHVTCRLTANNRDQLLNLTLGNRIWATFTFLVYAMNAMQPNK